MKNTIQSITTTTILVILFLNLSACGGEPQPYMGTKEEQSQRWEKQKTGMANPASKYCTEQGNYLTFRETEQGTIGICNFQDGSWCEEWAYYEGNCEPGLNMTLCGKEYWGKTICAEGYNPVCAKVDVTGETEWKTFDSACKACISKEDVKGYRPGKCEEEGKK